MSGQCAKRHLPYTPPTHGNTVLNEAQIRSVKGATDRAALAREEPKFQSTRP